MTKVSPLDLSVFFIWVMALTWGSAENLENLYFAQFDRLTWADARSHCQVCFKDLVTLTPENSQVIVKNLSSEFWVGHPENSQAIMKNLSSEFWVGLRKRAVNSTNQMTIYPSDDNSTFWSRWANGDPLTFQNWYPGYPVFKSPKTCCSCSCTCPAPPTSQSTSTPSTSEEPNYSIQSTSEPVTSVGANYSVKNTSTPVTRGTSVSDVSNTTNQKTTVPIYSSSLGTSHLSSFSTTVSPIESECKKTPMPFQDPESDLNKIYIEDPCVAMLSFGAWVEKDCKERLPFICYEDRFDGPVKVDDITSDSATITWERGPGDIEGYHVQVSNATGSVIKNISLTNLSTSIKNLSAGTFYSVKVFPVKCGRNLNPENRNFYTVPNTVSDLQVVNKTEKCVYLKWKAPVDNVDKYLIQTMNISTETENTEVNICNLSQGDLYNFSVQSVVSDKGQKSIMSNISAYTKPAKVSNLHTSEIKDATITLKWNKPEGRATKYLVIWSYDDWTQHKSFNNTVTDTTFTITDLPSGTRITMSVTALVNHTEEGERQTVVNFTAPEKITDLKLDSTAETINATWTYSVGSPNFTTVLVYQNIDVDKRENIKETTVLFENLNGAAMYTVKVYSVSGGVKSSEVTESIYTWPVTPRNPELKMKNETHLTFTWLPPLKTDTVNYVVTLKSSFWDFHDEILLHNYTAYTFGGLKSGTNYTFMVQTQANHSRSEAESLRAATDAVLKEITLSMVCSSKETLLCDTSNARNSAFETLKSYFEDLLGDSVVWSLESVNPGN